MGELLIACGMLRDELELAMARTGRAPETVWLDKGLHDSPGILRAAVQEEIDRREGTCRLILLGMAYCGGALDGVGSRTAVVAVPKFDDCVRLLLALEPENRHLGDSRSLYFTRQWMISDRYIVREMEGYRRTYGEKKAAKIQRAMLSGYRWLRLVDTGGYDLASCEETAQSDAASLGLAYSRQQGTVRALEKLLLHEFDGEFCLAAPGERITQRHFWNI